MAPKFSIPSLGSPACSFGGRELTEPAVGRRSRWDCECQWDSLALDGQSASNLLANPLLSPDCFPLWFQWKEMGIVNTLYSIAALLALYLHLRLHSIENTNILWRVTEHFASEILKAARTTWSCLLATGAKWAAAKELRHLAQLLKACDYRFGPWL